MKPFLLIAVLGILFFTPYVLRSHEGHHHHGQEQVASLENTMAKTSLEKTFIWLGKSHLIFLHFPIALIIMTAIAEILYFFYRFDIFNQASRFLVVSAAFFCIPTVLTGLAYAYDVHYDGEMAVFFHLHGFFGLFTALLAILTAALREEFTRLPSKSSSLYYGCLVILFITVNLAGFFGGVLTFGMESLLFPS